MGMYTELYVCTQIKNDPVPVEIIKYMLGDNNVDLHLPDHALFKTPRWESMLFCNSHSFVPRSMHLFEFDTISDNWCFISRSDFKNYDDEIKLFFDWLRPYLAEPYGMIGYYRYEQDENPTIVYGEVV